VSRCPHRLAAIERAAEIAERTGDDALMRRAVDALGREIADRGDPVVRAILDVEDALESLEALRLAAAAAGVELVPARRSR
jgi:hypothetical protein